MIRTQKRFVHRRLSHFSGVRHKPIVHFENKLYNRRAWFSKVYFIELEKYFQLFWYAFRYDLHTPGYNAKCERSLIIIMSDVFTSYAFQYLPFSSLALSLWFLPFFIAAKIMTKDYKFHLKETLFLVAAALIGSFSFNVNRLLTRDTALSLHIIEDVVVYFLLFF